MLDKWKQTFPREQSTHAWVFNFVHILIQDYSWLVRFDDSKPMRYDFLLNYSDVRWFMTKPVCRVFGFCCSWQRESSHIGIMVNSGRVGCLWKLISFFYFVWSFSEDYNGWNSGSSSCTASKCRKFYPFYATRTRENSPRSLRRDQ